MSRRREGSAGGCGGGYVVRGSVPALGGGFIVVTLCGRSARANEAIEDGARIVIVDGRAERVRR